MDTIDYLALNAHLTQQHPNYRTDRHPVRSPIVLTHDVFCQPGWNNVLVVWDATPFGYDHGHSLAIKVTQYDYCPHADAKYAGPSGHTSQFSVQTEATFYTVHQALKHAADAINLHANNMEDLDV